MSVYICKGEDINPQIKDDDCVVEVAFSLNPQLVAKIQNKAQEGKISGELIERVRIETKVFVLSTCWSVSTSVKKIQCLVVPEEIAAELHLRIFQKKQTTEEELLRYL